MTERYQIVTKESIDRMMETFCDEEEAKEFEEGLYVTCREILSTYMLAESIKPEETEKHIYLMKKMMGAFALFCRLNIETIHDLVRLIEFKEITEEEMKKLLEDIGKK